MNAKFKTYLSAYEALEAKQENGTLTMNEEVILCRLYEIMKEMLFNK